MENFAALLPSGEFEEAITLVASPSATPEITSNFHTALEECHLSSLDEVALGDHSGSGSSLEPKSEYFSARVEEMMRSKSQFSSAVEREIENSRVHWSEASGLSDCLEDSNDYEELNRVNEEVFAELINDPQWRHHEVVDWSKVGSEGGQGAIFELVGMDGNVHPEILLKVFKRGSRLSDLRKQWPCGILQKEVPLCIVYLGTMLPEDGRFAFVMSKCLGDLRKLIDQAMQEKNNQGPPFPYEWNGKTFHARDIMAQIAHHMYDIHKKGIIYRDLKFVNIFLLAIGKSIEVIVADFECSIGVVGTGFWRAPEILLALKERSVIDSSEKADVYSYGMTCFEIVISRLPFEGELEPCRASYDLVVEGQRSRLPSDLDVTLKDLIERCWNPCSNERPIFSKIIELLPS